MNLSPDTTNALRRVLDNNARQDPLSPQPHPLSDAQLDAISGGQGDLPELASETAAELAALRASLAGNDNQFAYIGWLLPPHLQPYWDRLR